MELKRIIIRFTMFVHGTQFDPNVSITHVKKSKIAEAKMLTFFLNLN